MIICHINRIMMHTIVERVVTESANKEPFQKEAAIEPASTKLPEWAPTEANNAGLKNC